MVKNETNSAFLFVVSRYLYAQPSPFSLAKVCTLLLALSLACHLHPWQATKEQSC
jgi:hypothetical protein